MSAWNWNDWLGTALIWWGAFEFGRRLERRQPKHVHRWGKWENWAITYQARYCLDCGRREIS